MESRDWHEHNNAYLSTSLQWLRLKLERQKRVSATAATLGMPGPDVPATAQVAPIAPSTSRQRPSLVNRFFGTSNTPEPAKTPTPAADVKLLEPPGLDQHIQQAATAREALLMDDRPPALRVLAERLGLSAFEQDIVLLCAAMELDPTAANLCAQTQAGKPYPTFALALELFDEATWDALSPGRPLRHLRLIEINQPGATPLTQSALRADERIVNYIKGLNTIDDRLMAYCSYVPPERPLLAPSQQHAADVIAWQWQQRQTGAASDDVLPIVQLIGSDTTAKQLVAREAALASGLQLLVIQADGLPSQPSDIDWLARLWQRESLLAPLALYLEATGGVEANGPLMRFVSRGAQSNGAMLIGVHDPLPNVDARAISVDVGKPTLAEQRSAWASVLSPDALENSEAVDELASQFSLNLPDIVELGQARAMDDGEAGAQVWEACNARMRPRLDTLAQRLQVKATWDDLVLADESLALLKRIAEQVRSRAKVYEDFGFGQRMNRGFGISALFAGESGTGKTMAAEVIANDLRLNLYRIDLSAVVSKYIGETEKNLRRLFDAAEDGGAILFFDEADALFGKRSEVKDSHDRYANIEINYLLQRMEAYSGLAILATNMKSALDTAFMRRLRFVVNFSFPGAAERKTIWQKAFPPSLPMGELQWDRLAKLNLSGGNIHNIALNAAFLSAEAKAPLSMDMVLDAARMELRKLDKPVNEVDMRR